MVVNATPTGMGNTKPGFFGFVLRNLIKIPKT